MPNFQPADEERSSEIVARPTYSKQAVVLVQHFFFEACRLGNLALSILGFN